MTDATPTTTPSKAGLWEDFIDIFYQPSAVFERRRDGQFGLALLILVVLSTVLYFALRNGLAPIIDAELSRQIAAMAEKNPQLTEEQLAGSKSMMEKFAAFGTVIFVPLGILITAALLWLAGRLVEAKIAFAAAMMIATYSQVPKLGELILNALQGLLLAPEAITSRYSVSIGIARFLDPDTNPVVLTVVGGLDVFTIWTVVLMAIGLSVVGRIPLQRAAIAAAAVWFVGMIPALFQAIQQS